MSKCTKTLIGATVLVISLLTRFAAAQGKQVQAPTPTQITTAKKVFIANAGGDERWHDDPLFTGGADRSYNQFYAATKSSGHYELVGSPAEADLIFEIEFLVPTAEPRASRDDVLVGAAFDPQIRLTVRDPRTNVLLWGFREHVQWAILRSNRDKNFDEASARIVADVQGLASRAGADTTAAKRQGEGASAVK